MKRIGDVAAALAIAPDTLRYYEKIGLIPKAGRTAGGARSLYVLFSALGFTATSHRRAYLT